MSQLKVARPVAKLRQGRNDWYRIEAKAAGVSEVYIYDEIGYFGVTAGDFVKDLQAIRTDSIDLHLNSPGGEVFDGIAIYQALKDHPANVTVYVDALAASAASFIAQAGDRRIMQPNATMMIHDGHGLVVGNSADMVQMAGLLDKTSDNIASIYASRAGGDVAEWRAAMRTETWYTATEAVTAGLADEVSGAPVEAGDGSWDLSVFAYAGRTQAPAPAVMEAAPSGEGGPGAGHAPFVFDSDLFRSAMREALR